MPPSTQKERRDPHHLKKTAVAPEDLNLKVRAEFALFVFVRC